MDAFVKSSGITDLTYTDYRIENNYIVLSYDDSGEKHACYISGFQKTDNGLKQIDPDVLRATAQSYGLTISVKPAWYSSQIYMTIACNVYYEKYFNGAAYTSIYRPYKVSGRWDAGSSAPNISVSNMTLAYVTGGCLMQYPACTTSSNLTSLIMAGENDSYSYDVTLNTSNPTKGLTYSRTRNMASNRAMWMPSSFHGSSVFWSVTTSMGTYYDSINLGNNY